MRQGLLTCHTLLPCTVAPLRPAVGAGGRPHFPDPLISPLCHTAILCATLLIPPLPICPLLTAFLLLLGADALLAGDIDTAAQLIASSTPEVVAAATSLAAAAGLTAEFAQAATQAVTAQGADATAVAGALSTGSGGTISPQSLSSGNADAAAAAVTQGVDGEIVAGFMWALVVWGHVAAVLHMPCICTACGCPDHGES